MTMERLTDPAQGYCEMYCENYGVPGCEPETCGRKNEVAMYEKLKEIEGIVPFERLLELAFSDRSGRCVVLPCMDGVVISRNDMKFTPDHWNFSLTAFAKDLTSPCGV